MLFLNKKKKVRPVINFKRVPQYLIALITKAVAKLNRLKKQKLKQFTRKGSLSIMVYRAQTPLLLDGYKNFSIKANEGVTSAKLKTRIEEGKGGERQTLNVNYYNSNSICPTTTSIEGHCNKIHKNYKILMNFLQQEVDK